MPDDVDQQIAGKLELVNNVITTVGEVVQQVQDVITTLGDGAAAAVQEALNAINAAVGQVQAAVELLAAILNNPGIVVDAAVEWLPQWRNLMTYQVIVPLVVLPWVVMVVE